jgi:FAD/FMN-containing dehydrogenase
VAVREADLFQAHRVSLGALGVMARAKLSVLPAFLLRETLRRAPLEDLLDSWDDLIRTHRNVEFFIFPYAKEALLKILDPVEAGDDPHPSDVDATVMQLACDLVAAFPILASPVQRLLTRAIGSSSRAAPAYRIFPSDRPTRFEEMEYELPAGEGPAALRAAIAEVRARGLPIIFPFEYRQVAADDAWLSPMNGRETISISFHQYAKMPWHGAFAAIEPVFAAHGGRPHWAKRHTLTSEGVLRLYPEARRWGEVRKRIDPAGKFLNDHLRALFAFSL